VVFNLLNNIKSTITGTSIVKSVFHVEASLNLFYCLINVQLDWGKLYQLSTSSPYNNAVIHINMKKTANYIYNKCIHKYS